jgi:hypothetical protein
MSAISVGTEAPQVLGPDSAGMLLTPDEFDDITEFDDGFRYELIRAGHLRPLDRLRRI